MRISFLSPPPNLSGGERVISIYAKRLAARGHDVRVICSQPNRASWKRCIKGILKGDGWPKQPEYRGSHYENDGIDYEIINHAGPIVDADVPRSDVIIATFWLTAEWMGRLKTPGRRIYFIQGDEAAVLDYAPLVQRVQSTWDMPFHKLTISQWLVDLAAEKGDSRAALVENSVDSELFFPTHDRFKQAQPTAGLLHSKGNSKGVAISLKAIEIASETVEKIQVVSFGEQQPTSDLPLPSNSSFHQCPAQKSLRSLYSSCDVWVCGSFVEGFHLPPLEAMACGTPVVSTRVGGSIDIIKDGINGYLVDVRDSQGLADRIVSILTQTNEEWKGMSEAALGTASAYTWEDATNSFENALVAATEDKWDEVVARNTQAFHSFLGNQ